MGLRLESVTPMALKRLFHDINFGNARMNEYQITLRKRNTYGVETFILYYCERQCTHE